MWAIIGHERAVESLRRSIAADAMPHALLFTGAPGVGKTHLALELAKALNCTGEDRPDQTCVQCMQIEHGTHPDVTIVERPEGKDSIRIEQIRDLRDGAATRPFEGRAKVCIIAGGEALTAQAADALLKTLEEPHADMVLVITATDSAAVPETVVSRCRAISLQPVPCETVAEALTARGLDSGRAAHLARLAQGNVGWALRSATDAKVATQRDEMMERLAGVLDLDLDGRLILAETLTAAKRDRSGVRSVIEMLLLLARDLMFLHQGLEPRLVTGATRDVLTRQSERLSLTQVNGYLHRLKLTMERIDSNVDARLSLEALFLSLP